MPKRRAPRVPKFRARVAATPEVKAHLGGLPSSGRYALHDYRHGAAILEAAGLAEVAKTAPDNTLFDIPADALKGFARGLRTSYAKPARDWAAARRTAAAWAMWRAEQDDPDVKAISAETDAYGYHATVRIRRVGGKALPESIRVALPEWCQPVKDAAAWNAEWQARNGCLAEAA